MSVLHICCNYADTRVYTQLFTKLADLGIRQQVYVPEKRPADMGKNLPPDDRFPVDYRLIVKPWDRVCYFTKARRAVPDIVKRVNLDQVTLIHAHTLFTDGGMAYRLWRSHGIPYVITVRLTDLSYFLKYMPHLRPHGLKILRGASRIVFRSAAMRDTLLDCYVPRRERAVILDKTDIIPNGIDPAWFDGAPRAWAPGEPLRIAFTGRLETIKQPLRTVEALRALQRAMPNTPICLHMAGTGPLQGALAGHPAAKEGSLVLHGYLEGMDKLKAFYDDCHLFLLPSRAETFGLVYLEAMSRGLPVLYTRGQGFDRQFPEGEVGFSVDPDDVGEMAEKAQAALVDYAQRSQRCIAAAKTMTWAHAADRWAALYTRCGGVS